MKPQIWELGISLHSFPLWLERCVFVRVCVRLCTKMHFGSRGGETRKGCRSTCIEEKNVLSMSQQHRKSETRPKRLRSAFRNSRFSSSWCISPAKNSFESQIEALFSLSMASLWKCFQCVQKWVRFPSDLLIRYRSEIEKRESSTLCVCISRLAIFWKPAINAEMKERERRKKVCATFFSSPSQT